MYVHTQIMKNNNDHNKFKSKQKLSLSNENSLILRK